MPLKFNPFTAQFDLTGSGGGGASYIDGEVSVYADLSLDAGVAPLNSAWLVRSSSGIWPFSKPAGIYYRSATGGVSRDADYSYGGTLGDVFSDSVFLLYDEASTTRTGQFNLGSITAGQNRVLTWPDGNGTIARTSDIPSTFAASAITSGVFDNARINFAAPSSIGSTTASSGAFTTLSASGTVSGTGFSTYLASPPNIGTTTPAEINGTTIRASGGFQAGTIGSFGILYGSNLRLGSDQVISWNSVSANPSGSFADTVLARDAANVLAMRNGANANTFRLYNTTDAGLTNFERGFMRWNANVFEIAAEAGGTGSNRNVRIGNINNIVFVGTTTGFGVSGGISVNAGSNQTSIVHSNCYLYLVSGRTELRGGANATDIVAVENGLLKFSGLTSSFPALKRSSTTLQVRLADDSAFAPLACGQLDVTGQMAATGLCRANSFASSGNGTGISFGDGFTSIIGPSTAGVLSIRAFNSTDVLVRLGGESSSWPALNTSGSTLRIRLADNSGFAPLSCGALTLNGNLDASTRNIVTDTTTGTKIGTGTTQLLGFWNATPAAQPAAVADATDAATVITQLNALLSRLRTIGVIAT